MPDNILDEIIPNDTEVSMHSIIQWWESKRLIYCFCLTGIIVFLILSYSGAVKRYGIENAIFESIYVIFIANLWYSIGWILEIWIRYYFPQFHLANGTRLSLFILGTLFSTGWAWIEYTKALSWI